MSHVGWVTVAVMLLALILAAYTSTAVTYPDGTVAEARAECAVLDLCATITLPDQDVMRIYNKGAERCEPFKLHLVRTHGDTVVLDSDLSTATTQLAPSYVATPEPEPSASPAGRPRHQLISNDKCPRFKNTYFTLNEGKIVMGVFLAKDGSLFVQFSPPK